MAWIVSGLNLQMVEGDFGIIQPIIADGPTIQSADEVKLTIKKAMNGDTILAKTFTNVSHNTINLELTSAETALLPVGTYVYSLDWYQQGHFMCNIIPSAVFKVVDKA